MPSPEILPQLPWPLSFLQLSDYLNCPRKTFHRHIAYDAKETKSRQQFKGINVHEILKRRIKLGEPLPAGMAEHERAVLPIIKQEGNKLVELALGTTASGQACGFFDPACRLRGRIDLCITRQVGEGHGAFIVDWKTGKPWEDPLEIRIQALLLKIHHPHLDQIMGAYYWLKENRVGKMYDLTDVAEVWSDVYRWSVGILNRIQMDDWPADENPLCPWCPCSKQQCEFKKDLPK